MYSQPRARANKGASLRSGRDVTVLSPVELKTISDLLKSGTDVAASTEPAANPGLSEAAVARRKRMEAYDEARKAAGSRRDNWEEQDDIKNDAIRQKASRLRLEETDEVKAMNQIIREAKIGAIRDAQVAEKVTIAAEKAHADSVADTTIEAERVRALRLYEERDATRAVDRRRGAAVLRQQIAEVEQSRRKELEHKAQEQARLVAAMERMKDEEAAAADQRRHNAKTLQREVAEANLRAIEAKAKAVEAEKEEALRIRKWIEERESRDSAIAAEEARVKLAKEREVARLRGQQQRVLDTRGQLDELRARRHQDEKEREQRQREAADARRRAELNAELERSRAEQRAMKDTQREKELAEDEVQRERSRVLAEEIEVFERQRHVLGVVQKRTQAKALEAQIKDRQRALVEERRAEIELTKRLRSEEEIRNEALKQLREEKIAEMQALDVPQQYKSKLSSLYFR